MPDIIFTVPPSGGAPSISLHETPHALESYQVSMELGGVTVTFQGTLESLFEQFDGVADMLKVFIFRQDGRQSAVNQQAGWERTRYVTLKERQRGGR